MTIYNREDYRTVLPQLENSLASIQATLAKAPVAVVNYSKAITTKTSGWQTTSGTITVPSGYELVPNCRPLSVYISGDARVTVTDRGNVSLSGSTCSFQFYLNNPNGSTASLSINATILFYRA